MPWWSWWLLFGVPAVIGFIYVFVKTMEELNPDPGWRRRQAQIRALQEEIILRDLRRRLADDK